MLEFNQAINELYEIFERNPAPTKINGCPCCVSKADRLKLHSKQLRELDDEDISHYAFKAMTTFGGVGDFKHFLPRIFELMFATELSVDNFVILGKLNYGNWSSWHDKEQLAVRKSLKYWWKELTINDQIYGPGFVSDFSELHKVLGNLKELLENWEVNSKEEGVFNLCHLLNNIKPILRRGEHFNHFSDEDINYLKTWLLGEKAVLSESYLHFVTISPEKSWDISRAMNVIDLDFEV